MKARLQSGGCWLLLVVLSSSHLVTLSAAEKDNMTVCKRVTYKGRVQGVGFRYTAQEIAAGYSITGYVRNLPSGDVELVAEGAPDQVDAFVGAIARKMMDYIKQTTVEEIPSGSYKGFTIRY